MIPTNQNGQNNLNISSNQGERITYTSNVNSNTAPNMLTSYSNQPDINQRISTNSIYAQPVISDNRATQRISNSYNTTGQALTNNQMISAGDAQERMTINQSKLYQDYQDGRMSNQYNVDPRISSTTNNFQDLRISNQMNIDPRFSEVRMSNTSYS